MYPTYSVSGKATDSDGNTHGMSDITVECICNPSGDLVLVSKEMLEMLYKLLPKTTAATPTWQQTKSLIYKHLDDVSNEQEFEDFCSKIPALLEFPTFMENLGNAIDKSWDIGEGELKRTRYGSNFI